MIPRMSEINLLKKMDNKKGGEVKIKAGNFIRIYIEGNEPVEKGNYVDIRVFKSWPHKIEIKGSDQVLIRSSSSNQVYIELVPDSRRGRKTK